MTAEEANDRLMQTLAALNDMIGEALERATGERVAYQLVCQHGTRTMLVGNLTSESVAMLLSDAGQKVGAGAAVTFDTREQV